MITVPPEEAPHARTLMMWPTSRRVYDDPVFLGMTQQAIADIANAIADFEPVTLLASGDHHAVISNMVSGQVELWDVPTEDLWCRDAGPLFARLGDGKLAVSHLQFNGWGKKQVHRHDARRTDEIARAALARHYPDREIVTRDVDPLGELGGGIHCATQQMPAV